MATYTASSTSLSDVQSAIDQSQVQDGDTVVIPEGESTWGGPISFRGKAITLRGMGPDRTRINQGGLTLPSNSRLTEIFFYDMYENYGFRANGYNWRIDHCEFETPDKWGSTFQSKVSPSNMAEFGPPTGVIDHNVVTHGRFLCNGTDAIFDEATSVWAWDNPWGSDHAVFIEDNIFYNTIRGNVADGNYGGIYVFRHNEVHGNWCEAHGTTDQSEWRGIRHTEIYENKWHSRQDYSYAYTHIRAGTGCIWGNTSTAEWDGVDNYFDTRSYGKDPDGPQGYLDGITYWYDQPGRGPDLCNASTHEERCEQTLSPYLLWDNVCDTGTDFDIKEGDPYLEIGRDIIKLEEKPSWYTPYTYPHPLTTGENPPDVFSFTAEGGTYIPRTDSNNPVQIEYVSDTSGGLQSGGSAELKKIYTRTAYLYR